MEGGKKSNGTGRTLSPGRTRLATVTSGYELKARGAAQCSAGCSGLAVY